MGRITSSIGLATGFPIQETVDQLIAISGRRRDLLVNQNKKIDAQRTAVTALTAQLIAIQIQVRRLGNPTVYSQRELTSSDDTLLAATSTGSPQLGNTNSRRFAARHPNTAKLAIGNATTRWQGSFHFRFGGSSNGRGVGLAGRRSALALEKSNTNERPTAKSIFPGAKSKRFNPQPIWGPFPPN